MKRYLQFGISGLLMVLFFNLSLEAASIEGIWKSDKHNVQIQIEQTYTGIKTKRFDQEEWFYYDEIGKNKYEDFRGNQYRFFSDQELVWKDAVGNKKFRFYKSYLNSENDRYRRNDDDFNRNDRRRDDRRYRDDYRIDEYGDRYGECNYTCREPGHHHRHYNIERSFRFLKGNWYNQRNGTKMKVKLEPTFIKVKTHRKWRIFYPISDYSFGDGRGNHITVMSDGRLRIKNRNGYGSSLYSKRRPVSYCY